MPDNAIHRPLTGDRRRLSLDVPSGPPKRRREAANRILRNRGLANRALHQPQEGRRKRSAPPASALDKLEDGRDPPEMRNVIHVGQAVLFATRGLYAPGGLCRITWQHDDR